MTVVGLEAEVPVLRLSGGTGGDGGEWRGWVGSGGVWWIVKRLGRM